METLARGKYFGQYTAELMLDQIALSEYRYTVPQTEWHYHENPYFMYVLDGNMIDGNKRCNTDCPKGSLMFNNWQEAHFGGMASRSASGFHLELDHKWLQSHDLSTSFLTGSHLIKAPNIHIIFAKKWLLLLGF